MAPKLLDFSRLSVNERLQLAEDLWDSIDDEQIPIPDWHREELDRRLAAFQADPESGIQWEELRERLFKLVR
ncbi:MAG: addiction module protein [Gemmatimonadetes bacterium]|nr:addiction module protein [Gemmatimonadota bacterium]